MFNVSASKPPSLYYKIPVILYNYENGINRYSFYIFSSLTIYKYSKIKKWRALYFYKTLRVDTLQSVGKIGLLLLVYSLHRLHCCVLILTAFAVNSKSLAEASTSVCAGIVYRLYQSCCHLRGVCKFHSNSHFLAYSDGV